MIMLSGSTYTIRQFFVFLVLLQNYPDDDHRKSDRNMLVINNIITLLLLVLLRNFTYSCNARVWNSACGNDFCCQICDCCGFQTSVVF
jgi:hypothetical protein